MWWNGVRIKEEEGLRWKSCPVGKDLRTKSVSLISSCHCAAI